MFSKSIYTERRRVLKENIGSGVLLFPGNSNAPINYRDNYYYFRQDSTFLYYFGISRPDLIAIIDCDTGKEIIFGSEYSLDDIVWMGKKPTLKELGKKIGIDEVLTPDEIHGILEGKEVHFLPPYRDEHLIKLKQIHPDKNLDLNRDYSDSFVENVIAQRSVKSEDEIKQMNEATSITCDMHEAAMMNAKEGMRESELTGMVHGLAIKGGGNISFPIILSTNGHILHNHDHHQIMEPGKLLLVDCGAENSMNYAGDMTRTFPVSARFSKKQADIYSIVLKAQEKSIESLQPGVWFGDVHKLAGKMIVEGLKDLGIMKGNTEDAVNEGAFALFMPHGLGHMIGLDVHDMENLGEDKVGYGDEAERSDLFGLKSLRLGKKLKNGYTITVEPGIYFIPGLMDKWEGNKLHKEFINYEKLKEYRDFGGIRIEDDYLITDMGSALLGKPLAKQIKEIEELRNLAQYG